ncbi:ATP-grasp domain-containing protein [Psychrobacillus sp. BM2]|uniref:ATP-grasp domain-containing protein n=1 Tax=Psychrobacillus sp. BM2 TaxID=3400421 RepID=UPI003B018EAB
MKKLIILGASILQLPGIITAKEMGLYTVSVDMDHKAIGRNYSDNFFQISTIDKEKVLEIASSLNADGIMTLASDQPMNTVAYVGSKLGLIVIPESVAISTTNKGVMRNTLRKNNIPMPNYSIVKEFEGFIKSIKNFNLPCIIKPTDSSGSRGVQLKYDLGNLEESYMYSNEHSKTGEVIIEEFLQGREFSVESISVDGNPKIIAITEKETTGAPYFVEMGHMVPANITKSEEQQIISTVEATIKALEINNGPSHCELMLTESGPKIIEIGARLGGDNITSYLVPLSTGYNMVKASINCAINQENNEKILYNRFSIIKYIDTINSGRIKGINGLENVENSPYFIEMKISKKIGDKHEKVKSSSDRIGYFIVSGEDRESLIKEANNLLSQIEIVIG